MGQNESSSIRVLVIGLTGSGKTTLLDLLSEEGAAGRPTIGYYEVSYRYEGCMFQFTEYGGSVDWERLVGMDTGEPPIGCVWFLVKEPPDKSGGSFTNALLMMASMLPLSIPFAIIFNGKEKGNIRYPRNRKLCTVTLPLISNRAECLEKLYRLLRWTSAQKSIV